MKKLNVLIFLSLFASFSFSQTPNPLNLQYQQTMMKHNVTKIANQTPKVMGVHSDGTNDSIISNNVFLQGKYTEVGVAECGCFGSTQNAPVGYHQNLDGVGNLGPLGFVADPAKDGWTVGMPPYDGDFFLPGSPEEGFGVQIDGTDYGNYSQCEKYTIPMTSVSRSYACNKHNAIWNGAVGGLSVKQTVSFADDGTYFTIKAELTNTTGSTLSNVYYMRNVDPDNEELWTGGDGFTTINTVVFEANTDSLSRSLVSAVGQTYGMYLGLCSVDSRSRVTYGGFSNRSASDIWNGTGGLSQSGTETADEAISISFNIGDIAAGETKTVEYAYVLDPTQVDAAFTELSHITANGIDITEPLYYKVCSIVPINLSVVNGQNYSTWTWSPATYLNTTTGTNVIFTPPVSGDYFYEAKGSNTCGDSITYHFELTISSGDVTPPIINTCPGDQTATSSSLVNYTYLVSATDNCASACTITQSPVPGTTISGTVPVTFTASDGAGNSSTCSMNVTYNGPPNPVATPATNIALTSAYVNWNAVSGATTYKLDVSTSSGFYSFVTGYNNLDVGNVTTYPVTGLTTGITYYFRVRVVTASGTSGNSNVISFIPNTTPPLAPVATAATGDTTDLGTSFNANWNSSTTATGYYLDVATDTSFTNFVSGYDNKDVGNVTSYTVSGLTADTTYYYRVRAYNVSGTSGNSNVINVTTNECIPVILNNEELVSQEGFEEYPEGQFPASNWSYEGNDNIYVDNSEHYSGNQSLSLNGDIGGDWELIACSSFPVSTTNGFTVKFAIFISSNHLQGCCHPITGEADLAQTCFSWPWAPIVTFDYSNNINSRSGNILGTYNYDTWYKIKMIYERVNSSTVKLNYYINDQFIESETDSTASNENDFSLLQFQSGDGSIWCDDINFWDTIPTGNISTCQGIPVTVGVTAKGPGLSYQWYGLSQGEINSATSDTVSISTADTYYCVVNNTCGGATSANITLTVNTPPSITGQTGDTSVCPGVPVTLSVQTTLDQSDCSDLSSCGIVGGFIYNGYWLCPVWQSFQAGITGSMTQVDIGIQSESVPITLNVYNGIGLTGSLLSTTTQTFSSAGWGSFKLSTPVPVVSGQNYTLNVVASSLAVGYYFQSPYNPYPKGTFYDDICYGSYFDAMAFQTWVVTPGTTYQWYGLSQGKIAGATSDTISTSTADTYHCVVNNTCGGTTSANIVLTNFLTPAVTNTPIASTCNATGPDIPLTSNVPSSFAWSIGAITGNITGASADIGSVINQTLTNPSNATAGSVEYLVTPTSTTGSCVGAADTITVTVNPTPVVTNTSTAIICSGTSPDIGLTSTVPCSFAWTIGTITGGITGAGAGSGDTINQILTNPSNTTAGTVQYIVTPTSTTGSCVWAADTITVTVKPLPILTNAPLTQTICSGKNTELVNLTSSLSGTTFNWMVTSVSQGISGFYNNLNNTIPIIPIQTLINASDASAGSVTYSISLTAPNGCVSLDTAYIITVNPLPVVTNTSAATICSGTSPDIALTSSVPGSFTWTIGAITGNITGASAGSGATINQTLTNPSNSTAGSVEYIVTPTSTTGSCVGAPYTITVTVNPTPAVTNASTASICSGTSPDIALTSSASSSFAWTIETITGGITGAGAGSGATINQTLTNPSNSTAGTVPYIVTPTSTTGSCVGASYTITVTVNPTPAVTNLAIDSICSGTSPNIALTSSVSGSFAWTIGTITGSITGAGAGSGATISQTLTNSSNATAGTVQYIITPTSTTGSCVGVSYTITVTVNPTPAVTNAPTVSICSGTGPNIALTSSASSSFTWTIGAITGNITGASAGSGATINQTLTNPSNSTAGSVEYIVTPTSTTGSCVGAPYTITVTVNPTPAVTNASTASICSGTSPDIALTSSASSSFAWTIETITGGITGAGAGSGATINQTLTNPSNSTAGTVPYIVTPTSTTGSCVGASYTITVTVNPTPAVTNLAIDSICSGTSPNIALTSSVSGSFAWTIGTITGSITGAGAGSGATISQTLTNSSNATAGTVQYIITPTSTTGSCVGVSYTITVTVNPTPAVTNASTASICSGTSPDIALTSSASSSFTWTIGTITGNITGASAGSGATINQILTNPSNTMAGSVEYIISPTSTKGSCTETDFTIKITVNSLPDAKVFANDSSICIGQSTDLFAIGGTLYSWSPQTGLNFPYIFNPTVTPEETTTYTVTTTDVNGCSNTASVKIIVNPLPHANAGNDTAICWGDKITLRASGGVLYLWNTGKTKSNIDVQPITTTKYTVTVTNKNGCSDTAHVIVRVNPLPYSGIIPSDSITICQGSYGLLTADSIKLTNNYQWLRNNTIITGATNTSYSASDSGSYRVVVTNKNNCYSSSAVTTVKIKNLPTTPIITGANYVCKNEYLVEYCIEPTLNSIEWSVTNGDIMTGQGTNCIKVHWSDAASGIVSVTVHLWNSPYCQVSDTLPVFTNNETAIPDTAKIVAKANKISTDILICKLCNYSYYRWGYENKSEGASEQFITDTCTAENWRLYSSIDTLQNYYWVYIGNNATCLNCYTKLYFNHPPVINGIVNPEIKNNFSIYPNPSNGVFNVELQTLHPNTHYQIVDLLGRIILKNNITSNKFEIDMTGSNSGIYLFQIFDGHNWSAKKIVRYN